MVYAIQAQLRMSADKTAFRNTIAKQLVDKLGAGTWDRQYSVTLSCHADGTLGLDFEIKFNNEVSRRTLRDELDVPAVKDKLLLGSWVATHPCSHDEVEGNRADCVDDWRWEKT